MRTAWGCDAPSEQPQDDVTCYGCHDDTIGCTSCGDARTVPLFRCPRKVVRPEHYDLIRMVQWSRDGGPYPARGGLLDQAAAFVAVRTVALNEIALCEEELREDANRNSAARTRDRAAGEAAR